MYMFVCILRNSLSRGKIWPKVLKKYHDCHLPFTMNIFGSQYVNHNDIIKVFIKRLKLVPHWHANFS